MSFNNKYRYEDAEDSKGPDLAGNGVGYDAYGDTGGRTGYNEKDVFGPEGDHAIKYKPLTWWMVAGKSSALLSYEEMLLTLPLAIMIAEIVSNGMLSLPSALAGRY